MPCASLAHLLPLENKMTIRKAELILLAGLGSSRLPGALIVARARQTRLCMHAPCAQTEEVH